MHYIIVDLEATCWEKGTRPGRQETIEIGAVRLDTPAGPAPKEFVSFVRPLIRPILSEFCVQLTGIRQEDVDYAAPFPLVFERFLNWIGHRPFVLVSWGAYDLIPFRNSTSNLQIGEVRH
jgi:3'-5' exoribonuclease 1